MNYLQFRQELVSYINQDNVVVTSSHLHTWIAKARRHIQRRYNFEWMQKTAAEFTLTDQLKTKNLSDFSLTENGVIVSVKDVVSLRITDTDVDRTPLVILAKEPDRMKFNRMVAVASSLISIHDYSDLLVLIDNTGIEGFPLIYNNWGRAIKLFPKVSGKAVGKFLQLDFMGTYASDLSSLPAGAGAAQVDGYEDFLFDQLYDVTYYRALLEGMPWLRQHAEMKTWADLYQEALNAVVVDMTERDELDAPTRYMGSR